MYPHNLVTPLLLHYYNHRNRRSLPHSKWRITISPFLVLYSGNISCSLSKVGQVLPLHDIFTYHATLGKHNISLPCSRMCFTASDNTQQDLFTQHTGIAQPYPQKFSTVRHFILLIKKLLSMSKVGESMSMYESTSSCTCKVDSERHTVGTL